MKLFKLILSFFLVFQLTGTEQIVKANGIEICCEAFGDKERPALLLIMGGCCQGIMWPTAFCEQLALQGFYVIRYDHRDTGLSSCFDFDKNPYDILDMTRDAVGVLDALHIEKAHLCGLSLGGPIAELVSIHYPQRVKTLTLIATSCDFRPMNLGYAGKPAEEGTSLSPTKEVYLSWMKKFLARPAQNREETLEQRMECWRILNGNALPFEEDLYRELHTSFLDRTRHYESIKNHLFVCLNSEEAVKEAPGLVRVPTLVIHGTEDPIFPPDHGAALSQAIAGSKYQLVHGMGHVLNSHFYELILREIKELTQSAV